MTYTTSPLVAQNNVLIQEYTQHIKSKYYYYDFFWTLPYYYFNSTQLLAGDQIQTQHSMTTVFIPRRGMTFSSEETNLKKNIKPIF